MHVYGSGMTRPKKTPEQISAVRQKASAARWHPDLAPPASPPPPHTGPLSTIADYDVALGSPRTWQDAKAREGVVAELIANERLRLDAEVYRGSLLTRERQAERERAYDDLVAESIALIPDAMAEQVPAEQRNDARRRGRELITEIRRRVAEGTGKARA
ncbi:MAG: hypothetical protein H0W48_00430 [Methylibium sp.]|nr:hypothetical protein [Methylibium sp.]